MGDRPPYLELLVLLVAFVALLIVGSITWYYLGSTAVPTVVGVPLGVLSGFLLLFVVYYAQLPRLTVELAGDHYEKQYKHYYLHLKVSNGSWGFLGGGTAADCRGELDIGGKTYFPKWATRPEPLLYTGRVIKAGELYFPEGIPQDSMMDAAKSEDIAPGGSATIDLAMKEEGDERCFVHEPENYKHPDHKLNPLMPGDYPFVLRLRCRNRPPLRFAGVLSNGKGTDPSSLTARLTP
jgi:hypothetical protein